MAAALGFALALLLAGALGGCAAARAPECRERILCEGIPFCRCVLDPCPTTSRKVPRCA